MVREMDVVVSVFCGSPWRRRPLSVCGGEGVSPSANQHSMRLEVLWLCEEKNATFTPILTLVSSRMQTGKVLTTGKDIKATQFTLGLTEKQGVKVALGFTKSNELFVGRMAMLGIAASIIGGTLNIIFV